MYSDQPTMPSSVVILRNELTRQPASQCRSSTLTIFIGNLLDKCRSRYQRGTDRPRFHRMPDEGASGFFTCRTANAGRRRAPAVPGDHNEGQFGALSESFTPPRTTGTRNLLKLTALSCRAAVL